jgi:hypothetical protein
MAIPGLRQHRTIEFLRIAKQQRTSDLTTARRCGAIATLIVPAVAPPPLNPIVFVISGGYALDQPISTNLLNGISLAVSGAYLQPRH